MAPKINIKERINDGELDLAMSELQDVPVKDIAQFPKVFSLDLSNNHLQLLPKQFVQLTHLVKLDLSKNKLTELPEDFGNLNKLKNLDLYSNNLTHLPLSFGNLKSLRFLDLKNNPLMPAIAKIAGPCLDNKQCGESAKKTVAFYSNLQASVQEEKEKREAQRQKSNEINQKQKQQQQQKVNKNSKKQEKQTNTVKLQQKETVIQKTSTKATSAVKKPEICKQKHSVIYTLFKTICWTLIILSIFMVLSLLLINKYPNDFEQLQQKYCHPSLIKYSNDFLNWTSITYELIHVKLYKVYEIYITKS